MWKTPEHEFQLFRLQCVVNLLCVARQEHQGLVAQSCQLLVTVLGQLSGISGQGFGAQGLGFGHALRWLWGQS